MNQHSIKWLLGIVVVGIASVAIFLSSRPATTGYEVSRTGPFYKLPENNRGHDDIHSEINVFAVIKASDKMPVSLVVCQGNITSSDTTRISSITINSMQYDWTDLAEEGGVFVLDRSGSALRTELDVTELLGAISSYNPENGLTSPNFEQKCRPKLVSLTKK